MKIPDIAEHQAIKLFTKEFGTDFNTRLEKFNEECKELNDVITEWNEEPTIERLEHIKDEFSDVQGTFTHLASLMGLYQREMLANCIDKVTTRKTNPDYKRFDNVGFINRVKTSIIPKPEFDEEIMGLKISFIEQEIKRESFHNNNQMYLAGRHIPYNWNEIKAAYFDYIIKKK